MALCLLWIRALPAHAEGSASQLPAQQQGGRTRATATGPTPKLTAADKRARRAVWLQGGRAPEGGDGLGVFTQPLGTLIMAADATAYLPLGVEIPLSEQLDLIAQVSGCIGSWYAWDSTSSGGWASVSVPWFVTPRRYLTRGWFIAPGVAARYLTTHLDHTLKDFDEARVEFADNIVGKDYELHAGVDVGYSMRIGVLELATVFGVSAGFCGNCVQGSVFFFGPMSRFFKWRQDPIPSRKNRFSLAFNLNVLRLGVRF